MSWLIAPSIALAVAAIFTGSAHASQYDFTFAGYYSGLRIANATGSLDWGDGRYSMNVRAKSGGIVDLFTVITHATHSAGVIAEKPIAKSHYYLSRDGKKKTEIELAFAPDDVEIVAASPDPKTENRSTVPAEMKRGSLDPLTAVLALGMAANEQAGCDGTAPVFDGRRRYDIVLENGTKLQYSGPNGVRDTFMCDFRFIKMAGYREKDKKWEGLSGKVWLQRLEDGMPMLPVRLEIETSFGTGYVHMRSANLRQ